MPGTLSVPWFDRAACLLGPSVAVQSERTVMEELEFHLPGIERADVFFFVCVGAFGAAFYTLF